MATVGELLEKLEALPTWKQVLFFAAIPLVIILLIFGASGFIESILEKHSRASTDAQSAKLDKEIQATQSDIDQSQGKIDQLKKDKQDAVTASKDDDPASFYNNRLGKPDNK